MICIISQNQIRSTSRVNMNQRCSKKMSLTPKNGRINVVIWNDSTMGRKRENVYYILPNIKLSTAKFDQICNRKLCTKEFTELLPIRLSPIHEENHKQLYEFWTLVPSICTKKYTVSLLILCLSYSVYNRFCWISDSSSCYLHQRLRNLT